MSRLKKSAIAGAMAVALVAPAEGLRRNAYPDPATHGNPWTVCYGHTEGVHRGDSHTVADCKALLVQDLDKYANGLDKCLRVNLPDGPYVALVSFAYNIGYGGACKSSVVRLMNEGRTKEGCDALLKYNRAAGVVFPGLTRRRETERELCLS